MAIGTWSKSTIDSPTAAKLVAEIERNLKLNTGDPVTGIGRITTFDSYTYTDWWGNSSSYTIYQLKISQSDQYGNVYCRLRVDNNLQIQTTWFTTWDKSQHNGQNSSGDINSNFNFNSSQSVNVFTVVSNEYTLVNLQQGGNIWPVGWLIPEKKQPWVKDSMYCVFFPKNSQFDPWQSLGIHPFGTNSAQYFTNLNNNYLAFPNQNNDNQSDSEAGIILRSDNRQGDVGKTSDDMVSVAAEGMVPFQSISDPSTGYNYRLLRNAAGGLAVRVTN